MSTDLPAEERTPDVHDRILAEAQRQHTAEVGRREAEAREWLTERVANAVTGCTGTDYEKATAAVDVFLEFLRNPPVRELHSDGTETVSWPA